MQYQLRRLRAAALHEPSGFPSSASSTTHVPDGTIHIWKACLSRYRSCVERFRTTLSAGESARGDRYCSESLRLSYILRRGILRLLLGWYLGLAPGEVRIGTGERGKPVVKGSRGVSFNTSSSGGLALYAIARNCEIGVDVEVVRWESDFGQVVRDFFDRQANEYFWQLPTALRPEAFFRAWTRVEAVGKAYGTGLACLEEGPLSWRFFQSKGNAPHQLAMTSASAHPCLVADLTPQSGYVGAVAFSPLGYPKQDNSIREFELDHAAIWNRHSFSPGETPGDA